MSNAYDAYKQEVQESQKDKSYDEIKETLTKKAYVFELDKLEPQEHRWIDRGLVLSCEGASHPHHRSFKRR